MGWAGGTHQARKCAEQQLWGWAWLWAHRVGWMLGPQAVHFRPVGAPESTLQVARAVEGTWGQWHTLPWGLGPVSPTVPQFPPESLSSLRDPHKGCRSHLHSISLVWGQSNPQGSRGSTVRILKGTWG